MTVVKVTGLSIWIHLQLDDAPYLIVDYTPTTRDGDEPSGVRMLTDHKTQFQTALTDVPTRLRDQLLRLRDYAVNALDIPELELGGTTSRASVRPRYFQVVPRDTGRNLNVAYHVSGGGIADRNIPISDATERLIENLWPVCEQLAWDHFRGRLGVSRPELPEQRKVYLSYRKGPVERKEFVASIADRLGREGFLPWFDDWDIKAGDSLPREIAAGLEGAYAIVVILTADYPGGKWAREELENAITQRAERNIKVVPILFEQCERPELVRSLRYVDCTEHIPEKFEGQFLQIIDALNEIDLNPYRR